MNYCIKAVEYYLPEKIISNEYLNQECGIDMDFLENKIGIKERRAAGSDETTSDLAVKAGQKLIQKHNLDPEEIDLIIVCTQNPDYRIPGTAGIVQYRLGIPTSSIGFDINLGCSGFVYALMIAGSLIKSGVAKKSLIIMADVYTKIIDYTDRATAGLFGDAAAASLIEACQSPFGFVDGDFGTDGKSADMLILPNSSISENEESNNTLFMDGREIFKFAVQTVPKSINSLLKRNNINHFDIKYFIFHQANQYILNELKRRLGLLDEQVIIDFKKVGNTVSSTIPIAYKNMLDKKRIKKDDLILFCGFGVGLSWGSILYRQQ